MALGITCDRLATEYIDVKTGDYIGLFQQGSHVFAIRNDRELPFENIVPGETDAGNWTAAFGKVNMKDGTISMVEGFVREGVIGNQCNISWYTYERDDWVVLDEDSPDSFEYRPYLNMYKDYAEAKYADYDYEYDADYEYNNEDNDYSYDIEYDSIQRLPFVSRPYAYASYYYNSLFR